MKIIDPNRGVKYFKNCWLLTLLFLSACMPSPQPTAPTLTLPAEVYFDKVHGAWQATMVANHTGLRHQGKYLDEPSLADSIEMVLLEQWSTDDDTAVEWVDLHIEDVTGQLPEYQTVPEIAARTQALAEKVIQQAGGRLVEGSYFIPGD